METQVINTHSTELVAEEQKPPVDNSVDLSTLFPAGEHGIYCYYGRIGQGKTYAMTADILRALRRGKVVYTNYPIDWKGFDQRESFWPLLLSIFGIKNRFYEFYQGNLRHIEVDENFHDTFAKLTDCIIALDEGYVVFDSYELAKMSMKKRKNVLHTRHFDRSIWYTTQRPNAVHVTMRAQTNVFYKVTKMWNFGFTLFRRQEFDLDSSDAVNEEKCYGTRLYFGTRAMFDAYNTKYLRYGAIASQPVLGQWHKLPYFRRFRNLLLASWRGFFALEREKSSPARELHAGAVGGSIGAAALKNGEGLNTVPVATRIGVKCECGDSSHTHYTVV